MTCKDCVHFEVCDSGRHIGEYIEDDGVYIEGVENKCLTFKNKADFAEVVRCKDCKHVKENKYMCICYRHGLQVAEESFCSYGERREE